jgi:phosphoribosylamine--glycine ligase
LADIPALGDLAETLRADLTVVGPEQPLVDGIADEFDRRGLRIIGPTRRWAQLEGSKVFAKEFLSQHEIPTASVHGVYTSVQDAVGRLMSLDYPVVLKADGLCGGKGVLVAGSHREAADFVDRALGKREFGDGCGRLLIEEALEGKELSFIVLCDGRDFVPLVPTRDHKRAFEGDLGPNTGGMGVYSCDGIISTEMEVQILERIVKPTMRALVAGPDPYRGFLYFGLMLTSAGPRVLEFNCRLGDPETQAIVARMDFDLGETLEALAEGKLCTKDLKWLPGASVCVVMASGGYPGKYACGKEIRGLEKAETVGGVAIFHAGTRREGHAGTRREGPIYYTRSGRVLGVTGVGDNLGTARRRAYDAVGQIQFSDSHYRRDIALAGCRVANIGEA